MVGRRNTGVLLKKFSFNLQIAEIDKVQTNNPGPKKEVNITELNLSTN